MTTQPVPGQLAYANASVADQIQHLVNRGMNVPNRAHAIRCLNHIGFLRLSSYWAPFESVNNPSGGVNFDNSTVFNAVMARYMFDHRLRSMLLEAFSFIEISVRAQWAHRLAHSFGHGNLAHQDPKLFDQKYHNNNLQELERSYRQIGLTPSVNFQNLTIWDVATSMSFGQLSKWYSTLTDRSIRQSISQLYGMDEAILRTTLRHLTKVRNICAHHERLWDLTISTGFRIPKALSGSTTHPTAFNPAAMGKIYNALLIIVHLLDVVTPYGDWTERFLEFWQSPNYLSIPEQDMGFPAKWREFAIWQTHLPPEQTALS